MARFIAPRESDVLDYFIEKLGKTSQAKIEADIFYNFYASKNWMVGKNKMKDYRRAISGWISRIKQKENENTSQNNRDAELQASAARQFGVSL